MSLSSGTALGPYRIVAWLGAGGMGEVYRAHDTRLGRDVAIKVLSPRLAATPEVRARFEREARTISQLNHPHICTLYDVGHQDELDYLVMELLDGETLAHRLEKGAVPEAEIWTLGIQMADALERAHRMGVVHRDLKPGNIMLTKSGAKLMDFGLARASDLLSVSGGFSESPTVSRPLTAEGTIVGTFQYMAPEQLEGKDADARSDLWALGCVLYETATGQPAFAGASQADLIAAILKEEPRPLSELRPLTSPALDRVIRQCVAKDPDHRWQSAADLARELEWVAAGCSQPGAPVPEGLQRRTRLRGSRLIAGLASAAVLVAAGAFVAGRLTAPRSAPLALTRLTFHRGFVSNARFTPDGKNVLYSAAWDGQPKEIFETRANLSSTRMLGLRGYSLLAVSRSGELALLKDAAASPGGASALAVVSASGSAPRELLTGVSGADWSLDGKSLIVIKRVGGEDRLEMPPGRVLAKISGEFRNLRVSPDGRRIAFTEHPVVGDNRGTVAVIDGTGPKMTLTGEFAGIWGLAWSPNGREIWFSAAPDGMGLTLHAVTLHGQVRIVARLPSSVVLYDVTADGRVLLSSQVAQTGIRGKSAADDKERELGWLDWPWPRALSADGKFLLLDDQGETAGPIYAVYLRSMDGSPPVRLGEGAGCALSPDARWALTMRFGPVQRLLLIPTGSGDTLSLPRGRVDTYQDANWLPDGRRIVCVGAERGRPRRTWIQEVGGGLPSPVTPEGITGVTTSPDGRWLATVTSDSTVTLFPLLGGEPRLAAKLLPGEVVSQWGADGRTLFVARPGDHLDVFSFDIQSGKRQLWKTFEVPDAAGVGLLTFLITRDARSYAYGYIRILDELYLVRGLQ